MAQKKKTASRTSAVKNGGKKSSVRSDKGKSTGWGWFAGAVVCLLLAIFAIFGYFGVEAVFISFYCNIIRGLVGYGFWFVPPALLLASIFLVFHGREWAYARLGCSLALPWVIGMAFHILLSDISSGGIISLWKSGQAYGSGGVLAGGLANLLMGFSRLGAMFIVLIILLVLVMIILRLTPADVGLWLKERFLTWRQARALRQDELLTQQEDQQTVWEEDGFEQEPGADVKPVAMPRRSHRSMRDFDLRVEDDTPSPEEDEDEDEEEAGESIFQGGEVRFEREPAVSPPHEIRAGSGKQKEGQRAQADQEAAPPDDAQDEKPPYEGYSFPPIFLLNEGTPVSGSAAGRELESTRATLEDTIRSFGIDASIICITRGPSVTRYELELTRGVKLNKVTNLAGDIALSLGASSVRIAPITGKSSVVGVEVPNRLVSPVPIREVIDSPEFSGEKSKVAFALGKDISGKNIVGNIAKLPHLLIAGTTGSGKSVCTNSLIISLLYKASPEEVRLIMVDPKMVELGIYNGIPHLLIPVVTDPKKAAGALQWAVTEMLKRYRMFSEQGVRELSSYNASVSREGGETLPQVVIVIDELADLMLVAAKEVEESICRVAQMGRAAGMHLIIATQRPSADVITGLMKANIPSRIAFAVASSMESRIILDTQGAEKLVGRGDMLYAPLGQGKPQRVQGCLISDEEVAAVVQYIKQNSESQYDDEVLQQVEVNAQSAGSKSGKGHSVTAGDDPSGTGIADSGDEMLPAAIDVVVETGMASVSMLQRRLKLGYARAARLVDQMEERGIVGPFEGSKPRQVLVTKEEWQEQKLRQGGGLSEDSFAAEDVPF